MCLLALFFRAVYDAPVVIAANREERFDRPGEPPRLIEGDGVTVRAVAGIDALAGGTWFGVNAAGVCVGVTNRGKTRPPVSPRSRGLLVRDLLTGCRTAGEATDRAAAELQTGRYEGCNVLCVDADRAVVIQTGDWLRVRPLPSGLHILTASDVNDVCDDRLSFAQSWLAARGYETGRDCLTALKELCAKTGSGAEPPIVLRGSDRGTVSSTLLALRKKPGRGTLLHAQGPPDVTPYVDLSELLRGLRL